MAKKITSFSDHELGRQADGVTIRILVTLNGLDHNPWHELGLRCNPFPQIGEYRYDAGERQIASLDGEPLQGPDDIARRLAGFHPEFIKLCIQQFRPGERVRFGVQFNART
jgi:hypothetical protein